MRGLFPETNCTTKVVPDKTENLLLEIKAHLNFLINKEMPKIDTESDFQKGSDKYSSPPQQS